MMIIKQSILIVGLLICSSPSLLLGVTGQRVNPQIYLNPNVKNIGYNVDWLEVEGFGGFGSRDLFINQKPGGSSPCGEYCTGSGQYPFGLHACLFDKLKEGSSFKNVVLGQNIVDGSYRDDDRLTFPKVVFSQETTFASDFNSVQYNTARAGGGYRSP